MEWNKMVPELTVSDFKRSFDFYTRVLGFKVVHRREPAFAYLDLDGAQIMLEEFHDDGWNVAELSRPYGRGINFQIEVSNVEKILVAVEKEGISLYRPLREAWYDISGGIQEGQKEFLVQDPDGYLLRFSEIIGSRPMKS